MNKLKLGLIYGGVSTEHEVSIKSYTAIKSNLDNNKYEVYDIYIDKDGVWYNRDNCVIENIISYLKDLDVIFPILHGKYGEDGSTQGLLEITGVPYVGCGVLSSSIGMDKVYSKIVFDKTMIKQSKYIYLKKIKDEYIVVNDSFDEKLVSFDDIYEMVQDKLSFPVFIKPSNSGSSVGINKANNREELIRYIEYASLYDNKILIEEAINGHEVECAVLGNDAPTSSIVGEILPGDTFYSYDAKYNNVLSKTLIPANISDKMKEKVREYAIKAYKALDCRGLSRVDFFVDEENELVYINEINTMPGFTEISMYPKLWESSGISYSELLDHLIESALKK